MKRAIIILAVSAAAAWGYTNLGLNNIGDPVYAPSAKASALGMTSYSSAKNASCVFFNAAAMSSMKETRLFFNLPVLSVNERVIPDTDWSGEEGGADYNGNTYIDVPDFALVFPFSRKLRLGAGAVGRQNFRYSQNLNTYSGSSYTGRIENTGSGRIKGYNFAASLRLNESWSAGYTYELLSGHPSIKHLVATQSSLSETKNEYSFSGAHNVFSLYEDKGMWNVAFTYSQKARMNYDDKYSVTTTTASASAKYKGTLYLPKTLALGFNCIWTGAVSASLYFDIVKTCWSDSSYTDPVSGERRNYKNSISYRLGIENDLTSRLQLRYGMAFIPSYERDSVERALITAGFGYYVTASTYFDFGYSYGRRNYIQTWSGTGISYSGRMDETMSMFNFSVDWRL